MTFHSSCEFTNVYSFFAVAVSSKAPARRQGPCHPRAPPECRPAPHLLHRRLGNGTGRIPVEQPVEPIPSSCLNMEHPQKPWFSRAFTHRPFRGMLNLRAGYRAISATHTGEWSAKRRRWSHIIPAHQKSRGAMGPLSFSSSRDFPPLKVGYKFKCSSN